VQPKDAYQHTAVRARRLLNMHDALVNTRTRSIRSDWAKAFCDLMHWPKSAEIERIDSKHAVIILRDGSVVTPDDFSRDSADDLLRAALAFGVSAFDRYVHERVVKGIVTALKKADLNHSQEDLQLPVVATIRIAERARRARTSGEPVRLTNDVRNEVQELLHKRPFQSWRELKYAFELIGVTGLDGKLQAAYRLNNVDTLKTQLGEIAKRRNWIVHEGDLVRHQRGGACRCREIQPKFVHKSLDFLDDLVDHLELVD